MNRIVRRIPESFGPWTHPRPSVRSGEMLRSSNEYIYVRGGGVYTFITNDVVGDVTLHTSEYTEKEERIAPVSEVQEAVSLQRQADRLIGELTDWASDSLISPPEKGALKQQQNDIGAEYAQIIAAADRVRHSDNGVRCGI